MYLRSLQGHGASFCPGSSGAPTVCMHGVTRWISLSISAKTGAPIRDMMRMLTTTYAESVSSTPICEMGEPTGPIEKGRTYMVRPRMEPLKSCFIRLRMTKGSSQLLVGPALSLEREQRSEEHTSEL